jgi:hypothetical protein
MANVLPALQRGLGSLQSVPWDDAPAHVQSHARYLADRISTTIQVLQQFGADVDPVVAGTVEQYADLTRQALDAADFRAVLDHAQEMIGALPGDPQSGQKPPWMR